MSMNKELPYWIYLIVKKSSQFDMIKVNKQIKILQIYIVAVVRITGRY